MSIKNEDLADLILAIIQNAEKLIRETAFLSKNSYYERAFLLSYTAVEEIAKITIITETVTEEFPSERKRWKQFWKRFRSHDIKASHPYFLCKGLILSNLSISKNEKYLEAITYLAEKEIFRDEALYVDFKEGAVICPEEKIDKKDVEAMFIIAQVSVKIFQALYPSKKKILEKWAVL